MPTTPTTMTALRPTPWDTTAFAMPTFELTEYSEAALQEAAQTAGHFTVKVDPLCDTRLLHQYGFYYCDSLIEPYCTADRLRLASDSRATISRQVEVAAVRALGHGAFEHGRFHRDFNLPRAAADLRYDNWLGQLLDGNQVYGLYWDGVLAGFIGHAGPSLVLHAVAASHRGQGCAKYWWSAVCTELFASHREIISSVSAANLAVLNLYVSLGFRFRNPTAAYHRLTT